MLIERLRAGDVDRARAAFVMMHHVFEEEPAALSDQYLTNLLADDSFWTLAAFDDHLPVGCITAHELAMTRHERSELFIYDLAVHVDHQRQGIGRRLVEELVQQAAQRGIDVVFVPADNEDTEALEFYRRLGGRPAAVTIFDLGAD